VRTLESLVSFASVDDIAVDVGRRGGVVAVRPRLRITAGVIEAVAPGEPGFEDLEDLPPDPSLLEGVAAVKRPRDPDDAG
jgi:hypothetical protein